VAYDEVLADRIRELIGPRADVAEKRMFGGLAFLVDGRMSVAVSGRGGLLVRVDPARTDALTRSDHVSVAVMGGRTMPGWLRVDAESVRTARQLGRWVAMSTEYAASLPPKAARAARSRRR
jgi:TfoX/Sxy family transcriptional regulator of competence genes